MIMILLLLLLLIITYACEVRRREVAPERRQHASELLRLPGRLTDNDIYKRHNEENKPLYTYTYIYIYIYIQIDIRHISISLSLSIYIYIFLSLYIYTYLCISLSLIYIYIYTYIIHNIHTRMYIYVPCPPRSPPAAWGRARRAGTAAGSYK